jgi:hypothetical protein
MLRVKSPQDFGSAIVIILIGAAGVYFGSELTMGTAGRMGPGYFPRLLSWLIIAVGLFIGLKSLIIDGPPIQPPQWRPMLFCLAAIILFGYMMKYVGLFLTAIALVIVAAYARPKVNLIETLIFGVAMSIGTILIFVYALGQPLPAWWGY